jgi:hypothetical protein
MLPPTARLPQVQRIIDQQGYFVLHAPRQTDKTTAMIALAKTLTVGAALTLWSQRSPRPLALFIDEIDSLQDSVLISVLRQLRDGYPTRPKGFPQSLALVGLRDVRDYKVASGGSDRLNPASPFNIKIKSLTMQTFTKPKNA